MYRMLANAWFRWLGGRPAFRVHGKGRREKDWREVEVYATPRRNLTSRWPAPFWRGTCITWTDRVIAVGVDFAEYVLREQMRSPASRESPVEVQGGRLRGARPVPTASEILAHEIGHTWQATRLGPLYLLAGACFTLFREGPHWYNGFENQASAEGLFGGIVSGSVLPELWERVRA
jgi:hypothetical protein